MANSAASSNKLPKIIIIDDEEGILDLLQLIVEAEFSDYEILTASSGNSAVEVLKAHETAGDIKLIFSDYSMANGKGSVVFNYNKEHRNVPFILVTGGYLEDYSDIQNFFETNASNRVVSKPFDENDLISYGRSALEHMNLIEKNNLKEVISQHTQSTYKKIRIKNLIKYLSESINVYTKLSNGDFVKVQSSDKKFGTEELLGHEKKGMQFAYLEVEAYELIKENVLYELQRRLDSAEGLDATLAVSSEALGFICSGSDLMDISPEQYELINRSVNACIKNLLQSQVNPELKGFLAAFGRDKGYLISHSMTMIHISYMLCRKMDYFSDKILEKLTYAAILHDINLANNHLSQILDLTDPNFELMTSYERKLIRNHPQDMAEGIDKMPGIPADVRTIVYEHHELPDGTGFPRGLKSVNISPMGCLFILALRLADHLFYDDKDAEKLSEFKDKMKEEYFVGNFKKPLKALLEILPD